MPEKVKKPANPTTNLLQNIRSPRPSQIDENVPKSKHYRSELEPLLGAVITLKCPDWTIFHEEHYTKILLKGASVMKAPSGRCVSLPIAVYYVGTTYHTSRKTLITPKGQVYLAKKVSKEYKG